MDRQIYLNVEIPYSFETTKDLRNRQNSLSKSMLKATGSLLQGDALLIKSSIANTSKTPDDLTPTIVVEPSKETAGDPIAKDKTNEQKKLHAKGKNGITKSDLKVNEKDDATSERELDDKTPTNEISTISSMNEMTDNSILKESLESEKQVLLMSEDLKNDLIMADEEKDDDNSERNKFVNAWVARLACKEKGELTFHKPVIIWSHVFVIF